MASPQLFCATRSTPSTTAHASHRTILVRCRQTRTTCAPVDPAPPKLGLCPGEYGTPDLVGPSIIDLDMHVLLFRRDDFIFLLALQSWKFIHCFLHDAERFLDLLVRNHQGWCESDDV
jgi:hypothetical protein